MMQTVGKIEAASHQLDWAIRLLIDHDAPMPAITLAGAAEEILGRGLTNSAHEALIREFSESHDINRRDLSQQYLNKARNWLKHWDHGSEPEYATFDLVQEAVQGIARGISNMSSYNQSIPSEGPRFLEWIKQNSYLYS
jgi:hypothetical protein